MIIFQLIILQMQKNYVLLHPHSQYAMARLARKQSGTGIYHVMLRGNNLQDIFEDQEDYRRLLICLRGLCERYDDYGVRLPALCTLYAYCMMSNHVHLLLQEKKTICFGVKNSLLFIAKWLTFESKTNCFDFSKDYGDSPHDPWEQIVDYTVYMETADRRHEIGKACTKRAAIVILLWFLQSNLQQACQYYFLIVFLPLII